MLGFPLLNRRTRWLLVAALMLGVACRSEPEAIEGAPAEPVAAVKALAEALQQGDLQRFNALSVPLALQAEQPMVWRHKLATANPIEPEQAERYAVLMQELTAPDAEAALWAKAEPRLALMAQEMGPKWTVGVTMMAGFATAAVAANATLSEAEKAHAQGLVDAFKSWAGNQETFTNPAHAKAAIAAMVSTARSLQMPTLQEASTLDYAPMLEKAGVAFRGGKAVATAYGIDVDAALSQVEGKVIALEGTRAVVEVSYPLMGQTVRFEQPMVLIDGGWYREDVVQTLTQDIAAAQAAADAATATAAIAPTDAPAPAAAPAP